MGMRGKPHSVKREDGHRKTTISKSRRTMSIISKGRRSSSDKVQVADLQAEEMNHHQTHSKDEEDCGHLVRC